MLDDILVEGEILPSQPIAMQTLQDVYALWHRRGAKWSRLDNLSGDIGSPQYLADMAKDLTPYATAQPIEQGEAVWKENAKYLLDTTPNAIRVKYKHGEENLMESLILNYIALRDAATPKGAAK